MIVPGVYQLLIRLPQSTMLRVGGLGPLALAAGWYVYSGSARNGLHQRVGRHLRRSKRPHWHIDYLLAAAERIQAYVLPGTDTSECDLHRRACGAGRAVPGFGASDCRCDSHLAYFKHKPKIPLLDWRVFVQDTTGRSGVAAHS